MATTPEKRWGQCCFLKVNFTDIYCLVLHCILSSPPVFPPKNICSNSYQDLLYISNAFCANFQLIAPLSSTDSVLLTLTKYKNFYYLLWLVKLRWEYNFSVSQYVMSLAVFPPLSKHWSGDLTVLMVPEPHDPDMPAAAAAGVKRDIYSFMNVCARPAQLEPWVEETGVFNV